MKIKEHFYIENCEECPCYHAQWNKNLQEVNGGCEWKGVVDVPPRAGVPPWCWLRDGALVVEMKKGEAMTVGDCDLPAFGFRNRDQVALANVSGALCDTGSILVPSDPMKYGEAIRELTAERDAAVMLLHEATQGADEVNEELARLRGEREELRAKVEAIKAACQQLQQTAPNGWFVAHVLRGIVATQGADEVNEELARLRGEREELSATLTRQQTTMRAAAEIVAYHKPDFVNLIRRLRNGRGGAYCSYCPLRPDASITRKGTR